MENEWISVKDRLPEELANDFHNRRLWLNTKMFGRMEGFYMCGKFWYNYVCEIHNVIHWMPLPEPPKQ